MNKKGGWILKGILIFIAFMFLLGGLNYFNVIKTDNTGESNSVSNAENTKEPIVPESTTPESSDTGKNSDSTSNDYVCPDLSSMKLQNYDSLMQTWTAQVSPYKSGNLEVIYTYNSQIEEGTNIIYCDAGSEEGQNANWVYCGDFLRPIVAQYTDSDGSIIKKKSIEVTFDKNTKQYLATKCDTYDIY